MNSRDISVEVQGVSKSFGSVIALNSVSLNIFKGEFFSLLGPSGCGKTTLLRMIGGFEIPDDGSILIEGSDTSGLPPYERSTNMIFQHLALFPHMNVWDNVAFGLKMKGIEADIIGEKVKKALQLVRLEDYGSRKIDQLSGGQRQRVAMSRALINDPTVLLLDEPLGALDLQLRLSMQDELRRLHKSLSNTFIFVTHDQGEAMAMSDRIAVMDQGEILQVGTPEEIYDKPKTRFVANFVGHTNVFDGQVSTIGNDGNFEINCNGLVFMGVGQTKVAEGQKVSVALRYEAITLSKPGNEVKGLTCSAVVREKMYLGGMFRFETVTVEGLTLTADIPQGEETKVIKEGDKIELFWEPESLAVLLE